MSHTAEPGRAAAIIANIEAILTNDDPAKSRNLEDAAERELAALRGEVNFLISRTIREDLMEIVREEPAPEVAAAVMERAYEKASGRKRILFPSGKRKPRSPENKPVFETDHPSVFQSMHVATAWARDGEFPDEMVDEMYLAHRQIGQLPSSLKRLAQLLSENSIEPDLERLGTLLWVRAQREERSSPVSYEGRDYELAQTELHMQPENKIETCAHDLQVLTEVYGTKSDAHRGRKG